MKAVVMRGTGITFSAFVFATFMCISGIAAEPVEEDEEQQYLEQERREEQEALERLQVAVAKFQSAETSQLAGEAVLQIFSPYMEYNDTLIEHDDANVAIHAAWSMYSRMVPRRHFFFGAVENETIDPRDCQRFLGFLEGRMRVGVPEWWEVALADPGFYRPKVNGFDDGGWLDARELVNKDLDQNAGVEFEFYDERFTVPAETYKKLSVSQMGIAVDENYAALLNHSAYGFATKLYCVSRKTSQELWRADVWGLGPDPVARTGSWRGPTYMGVTVVNDKVFVFLAWIRGVCVEAFSINDGTPLLRFATNNWGVKPKKYDRAP